MLRPNLPCFPVLKSVTKLTFLFSCQTILGPGKNNLAASSRKYLLLEDKAWTNWKRLLIKTNSLPIRTCIKTLTVPTNPTLLFIKSSKSQLIGLLAQLPFKSSCKPYKYASLTSTFSAQTLLGISRWWSSSLCYIQ